MYIFASGKGSERRVGLSPQSFVAGGTTPDEVGCCCATNPCKDRPYWSGTGGGAAFWGVHNAVGDNVNNGLQFLPVGELNDLNKICIFAFGTGRSNIATATYDESIWSEFVNEGGILMMGAEYIPIFPEGERTKTNSLFSTIGSTIRMSPGNFTAADEAVSWSGSYACSGPHGWDGVVNKSVRATRDLPNIIHSGGATSVFRGGTTLLTAPPCEIPANNKFGSPGGASIVGEIVGKGQVYMAGDSNYPAFPISRAILDALDEGVFPL